MASLPVLSVLPVYNPKDFLVMKYTNMPRLYIKLLLGSLSCQFDKQLEEKYQVNVNDIRQLYYSGRFIHSREMCQFDESIMYMSAKKKILTEFSIDLFVIKQTFRETQMDIEDSDLRVTGFVLKDNKIVVREFNYRDQRHVDFYLQENTGECYEFILLEEKTLSFLEAFHLYGVQLFLVLVNTGVITWAQVIQAL